MSIAFCILLSDLFFALFVRCLPGIYEYVNNTTGTWQWAVVALGALGILVVVEGIGILAFLGGLGI